MPYSLISCSLVWPCWYCTLGIVWRFHTIFDSPAATVETRCINFISAVCLRYSLVSLGFVSSLVPSDLWHAYRKVCSSTSTKQHCCGGDTPCDLITYPVPTSVSHRRRWLLAPRWMASCIAHRCRFKLIALSQGRTNRFWLMLILVLHTTRVIRLKENFKYLLYLMITAK